MKIFCARLCFLIASLVVLTACTNPLPGNSTNDSFIEIQDARGEVFTLSYTDLFYRFYFNAHKSAVLAKSWEHPSAINPNYLTNFFVAQSNWNQVANDAVTVFLNKEHVEDYLRMYFDVESTQIRQSASYRPEKEAYELPLYPLEHPSVITDAAINGNVLTLFYETYNDYKEDLPLLSQGQVTIEIEKYPHQFCYIANEITFIANTQ